MSYLFQATGVENPKSCERWNLSVLFWKNTVFSVQVLFFWDLWSRFFFGFCLHIFCFGTLRGVFDGKSNWIKVFFLLRLENPSQIMVITCGYPTLISQQLDIWDTPRNCWVPKCWIQLDINSLFLHVDLFFGMTWTHWYLTQTQTQMGVDTTDLDIPSQIKGFDHYPNTPRKLAEWRAPLQSHRSHRCLCQWWHGKELTWGCVLQSRVDSVPVFHLRPPSLEDRELLEANADTWCNWNSRGILPQVQFRTQTFQRLSTL